MGLWACATVQVDQPKRLNIKDIVLDVMKEYDGEELIVTSSYSKDSGVLVEIRTDCYLGDSFNTVLVKISKKLKQEGVEFFHIEVLSNWYL